MSYITASDSGTQAVNLTVYDYGNPVFTALYTDFATLPK